MKRTKQHIIEKQTGISPTMINLDVRLKERLREFVNGSLYYKSMTQVVVVALKHFLDQEEGYGKF